MFSNKDKQHTQEQINILKEYFKESVIQFLEFLIIENKPASYIQNFNNLLLKFENLKGLSIDIRKHSKTFEE